tara:strand:+ start:3557 stop:3817 length:261 start_codon:yes stop_codon:yes gene_type:complete
MFYGSNLKEARTAAIKRAMNKRRPGGMFGAQPSSQMFGSSLSGAMRGPQRPKKPQAKQPSGPDTASMTQSAKQGSQKLQMSQGLGK